MCGTEGTARRSLLRVVGQPAEGCRWAWSLPLAKWLVKHGRSGASACDCLPVSRRRGEREGTLKGNKAHGWIGCAASETAVVHYGLVSGAKPCSWAASSRTSSLRHLETGGAGARGQRLIPGGVLLAAHHRNPEAQCSRPGFKWWSLLRRGLLGVNGLPQLAAEERLGGFARTLLTRKGRLRPAQTEGEMDADFLADAAISVAAFVSGTST